MGKSEKASDVFETGKFQVKRITVGTENISRPPRDLFIVTPVDKGTFPVLLFCHGFMLQNTWYTFLFNFIASHGYIVVAPQFYGIPCSIPEEVRRAARVTEWLPTGLRRVLPANVAGDTDNLAITGHSRGGQVAFALALGRLDSAKSRRKKIKNGAVRDTAANPNFKFKAIIGVDPVAGLAPAAMPEPRILEFIPRCFNMSIPVAVIGTGFGNQSKLVFPPFAPNGVNHSEFYNESRPPAAYFLAKEYGHVDMMDDNWFISMMKSMSKTGKGPVEDMKRATGGIMVAFLRAYLEKKEDDLDAIVDDPTIAPILVDPVIFVKE